MEKNWISRNLIRQTSKGIKSYPQNVQLAARTFGVRISTKDACAVVGGMLAPDYKIFFLIEERIISGVKYVVLLSK